MPGQSLAHVFLPSRSVLARYRNGAWCGFVALVLEAVHVAAMASTDFPSLALFSTDGLADCR